MDKNIVEFVVYIINEVSNQYDLYPSQVYKYMSDTGCINQYLIPYYDVLHTLSSQNVSDDVITFMKNRGVSI